MKNKNLIPIDDMEVYQIGMAIGHEGWSLVDKWDQWKKDTIDKQFGSPKPEAEILSPQKFMIVSLTT